MTSTSPLEPLGYEAVLDAGNPIEEILSIFDLETEGQAVMIHNQLVMVRLLRQMTAQNVGLNPFPGTQYEQNETRESGGISVPVGERKTIVSANPDEALLWYEVGTTSTSDTNYYWVIDGDELFNEPQYEPLGAYNSVYQFPNPIVAHNEIRVDVRRIPTASGATSYSSKVRYLPISTQLADSIESAWST